MSSHLIHARTSEVGLEGPVVVAPVYVPTCNFVSVPVVNAYTGWTYMVTRRVCN